jgi:hypothetical protein
MNTVSNRSVSIRTRSSTMTGKHRRPHRSTGRTVAATAAVLAAGALPVAAAGSAFADAAPTTASPLAGLPLSTAVPATLPLGLGGLEQAAGPLQGALPLTRTATGDLADSLSEGDLPVGGVLGASSPQALDRAARMDEQAAFETAGLATAATGLTGQVASSPEVAGLMQAAEVRAFGQPFEMAPDLLHDGTLGSLAQRAGGRAMGLTDELVTKMSPTVDQLRGEGVPTVGDVTGAVSRAKVPVFGTVGGLTSTVPVTQTLGADSPVLGTVGAASAL